MEWTKLLNTQRIRKILGGPASRTVDGEERAEFDRDYDRVIFSTPVRRLQDKTQVFPLDANDSVRTRLTHSMEVSTLSRSLGARVAKWLEKDSRISSQDASSISTIAATCGLIHDLGNPPFGHAGEAAIASWFTGKRVLDDLATQQQNDFIHFEGNAQTLRIVSRLQLLVDEYGINFTAGTLSATLKYVCGSDQVDENVHERSKHGYFESETELVKTLQELTTEGQHRNPIACLVEAADDMVYATVDLEDGVKKGVISWADIHSALSKTGDESCLKAIKAPPNVTEAQASGDVLVQFFRTNAIGEFAKAATTTFQTHYDEIMAGTFHHGLLDVSPARVLLDQCKRLGREKVYVSHETLRLELMGRHVIHGLMSVFWEGVSEYKTKAPKPKSFPGKIYNLISGNHRRVFEASLSPGVEPSNYRKLMLVTDYVSGMTDSFALNLYRQLVGSDV